MPQNTPTPFSATSTRHLFLGLLAWLSLHLLLVFLGLNLGIGIGIFIIISIHVVKRQLRSGWYIFSREESKIVDHDVVFIVGYSMHLNIRFATVVHEASRRTHELAIDDEAVFEFEGLGLVDWVSDELVKSE